MFLLISATSPPLAHATFPGANGKIAFTSVRDGSNQQIYVMNPDGTGQTNCTNNPAHDDFTPAWSPDGTKIAFGSTRDGNQEIYVMNADCTGVVRLTHNSADDNAPAWSPDGTKIAFYSNRDGNGEIYIMDAAGTVQTNCTNNVADDGEPDWSPDGTKIAFTSYRDGNQEIYVTNANCTGTPTRLTNNLAGNFTPSWSPDGTEITFSSSRDSNVEVYVMNADGTGQTNCTNNPAHDDGGVWSPDGTKIAFRSTRAGIFTRQDIWVMNADCTAPTRLTDSPGDYGPDWQPLPTDADNDGFSPPQDCNDNNPDIHPGAQELCNGVDDNCNGTVDEGFDVGASCTVGTGACQRTGTKVCTADGSGTQCNATPGTPGTETCNGIDDDCDGAVDESPTNPLLPLSQSCYSGPAGTQGVGICQAGTQTCLGRSFGPCAGEVTPVAEVCGDGIDQDCNGQDVICLVGPPTNKDQCKDGGWKSFNNPPFQNQGQCVSYVNGRRP